MPERNPFGALTEQWFAAPLPPLTEARPRTESPAWLSKMEEHRIPGHVGLVALLPTDADGRQRMLIQTKSELVVFVEGHVYSCYLNASGGWFEVKFVDRLDLEAIWRNWGEVLEASQRVDAQVLKLEDARRGYSNTAREISWLARLPEWTERVKGFTGISGVVEARVAGTAVIITLDRFKSQFELGDKWIPAELDGPLNLCYETVYMGETRLILPEMGLAFPRLPHVRDRVMCLDAGLVNYQMAMRENKIDEAIMGVLAQLRSLASTGYTAHGDFVKAPNTCLCGTRNIMPATFFPTRAKACPVCSIPCLACGKVLGGLRTTSRATVGPLHTDCSVVCEGCHLVKAVNTDCILCGPLPLPCSVCGKEGSEGRSRVLTFNNGVVRVCQTCYSTCTACGTATLFSSRSKRCVRCRRVCVVCLKGEMLEVGSVDSVNGKAHRACTKACIRCTRPFRSDAMSGTVPAVVCYNCSTTGWWFPANTKGAVVPS